MVTNFKFTHTIILHLHTYLMEKKYLLLHFSSGCKIKALRAKTNTYIKTPVRGEDPIFAISGRPEHVSSAKWEILAAAEHFTQIRAARASSSPCNLGSGQDKVTIHVRVPYRVVGLVVGPKGATVKRIQQITQTYIVTPSRDKEPCFEVKGTPENVERARKEIESYIALRTGSSVDETFGETFTSGSPDSFISTTDQLARQMQQCQVSDPIATPYQFPRNLISPPHHANAFGETFDFSGLKGSGREQEGQWRTGFTPPDKSYQPMSAPLLASENGATVFGSKPQPLSPTGSYESNSSDGIATVSPKESPLLLKRELMMCYVCKVEEVTAALLPCMHKVFCQTCAYSIACSTGSCPLCNAQVTNVLHLRS